MIVWPEIESTWVAFGSSTASWFAPVPVPTPR